ncbi:probable cytochrome P450 12c1, mitochondrial [Drosophila innubila]|uniref:probable cytochrome P450 12c1, mitochondrial n=1 Tax=Drosophila innubila TaxID=198719 RepID=UPI00148DECF4|nr:probable cytochrome P450 12c1, mitochondrial [Drosophila innubila]
MLRQSIKLGQSTAYRWSSSAAALKTNAVDSSYVQQLQAEWKTAKSFKELPGPTRWQMFRGFMNGGEYAKMDMRNLMIYFRELYGDTFLMPGLFGMPNNLVTFNVDNFEKAYRTEGQWPVRPGSEVFVHYREKRADGFFKDCMGLLSSGEQWGRLRSIANPVLMQHRNAASYLQPMQRVNQQFVQRIREIRDKDTQEVPGTFLKEINHLTFESVAVVALDRELGLIRNPEKSPKAQKLFNSLQNFMQTFYELTMMPSIYKYVSTPTYRRFSRAMDDIFEVCSFYINQALERIEKNPADSAGMMSVLEQLARTDRKFAIVMSIDMLMGGVDTTSSALSGIMLNLAKNPEKQAKLREEIVAKLPHPTDEFTFSDMKALPYLRAFIKESLRVYPVAFGNLRATGADMVLDGYRIPKHTRLLMNSNLLLDDERFYPRAKEFLPERWLRQQPNESENLVADNMSPFVYLPFGFGPRMCVGKRIVDMEMEITVANLVRNFQVEYKYPTENAFKSTFINQPVIPLKFKFTDIKY